MANSIVEMPYKYFGSPDVGRPLAGGFLFIGKIDLDPTIPANQKTVTLRQEDGTEVVASQPIGLGGGGYPIYNGSPVTVLVDGAYSMVVQDIFSGQKFYSPNVLDGAPVTADNVYFIVDDVAALVASDSTPGQFIRTAGYYSRDGKGGAPYYIKTAAQAALDGDVIDGYGNHLLDNGHVAIIQEIMGSYNCYQFGAVGDGLTDDSAAINAAVSLASVLDFPKGKYLVSNISLSDIHVRGIGVHESKLPYDSAGSVFIVTDTVNPAFLVGKGVSITGINVFYPDQDGVAVTPIVYPVTFLFGSDGIPLFYMDNCTLINPYIAFDLTPTAPKAIGRIYMSNIYAYAVKEFMLLEELRDDLHLDNFIVSPGIYQDITITGAQNLRNWTQANGVFLRLGVHVVGLSVTNGLVYGYRTGISTSGVFNLSNVDQVSFDSVPQVMGTFAGSISAVIFSNIDIYAEDPITQTVDLPVFSFTGSTNTDIIFNTVQVSYAQGTIFNIFTPGTFHISNCIFRNWGKATGLAVDKWAINCNNSQAKINVSNISATSSYSSASFLNSTASSVIRVDGCILTELKNDFVLGQASAAMIHGNISTAATGVGVSIGTVGRLSLKDNDFDVYKTTAKGTSVIPSGSTSVVINHGLSITPNANKIILTPTGITTNNVGPASLTSITPTTITVSCRSDPGVSGLNFSWSVID